MPELTCRRGAKLCAALLLVWAAAGHSSSEKPAFQAPRSVRLANPRAHLRSLQAMDPHVDTSETRVRAHLRIPGELIVHADLHDDGSAPLRLPAGSVLEVLHERACDAGWCIQRLHGVRVAADGTVLERILVPQVLDGNAPLRGVEWVQDDEAGHELARRQLARMMVERPAGTSHPELMQTLRSTSPLHALRDARRPGTMLCAMRAALMDRAWGDARRILHKDRTFCGWVQAWARLGW